MKPLFLVTALASIALASGRQNLTGRPVEESLLPSLASGNSVGADARRGATLWVHTYSTIGDMVTGVDAVVAATATGSTAGREVISSRGEVRSRFELVAFQVDEVLKVAESHAGELASRQITVERFASQTAGSTSREPDIDGGSFVPGQRYVLFLKKQKTAPFKFYQVNNEGRFSLSQTDQLVTIEGGRVSISTNGKSLVWLRNLAATVR